MHTLIPVFSLARIRFRRSIPESAHENRWSGSGRKPHQSGNGGIPRFPYHDQPVSKPATAPKSDQTQSRTRIPESVQDGDACDRQSPPGHSRKQRNTAVRRLKSAGRAARHTSIPVFLSTRIRFRRPIPESVRGNRRSGRLNTIHTHPKTAESRGSHTMTSRSPNRPRPRNRTKPNPAPESPNQSTEKAGTAYGRNPQSCGSREIPKLPQYSTPNRSIIPPPPADRIGFRHPIPESVRGYDQNCGGRSNARQPVGHKNNNPAYFTEGCRSH